MEMKKIIRFASDFVDYSGKYLNFISWVFLILVMLHTVFYDDVFFKERSDITLTLLLIYILTHPKL